MTSKLLEDPFFKERPSARYLEVSVYTLQQWRSQRKGPDFVRVGGPNGKAIRYRKSALDAWIDANTVHMGRVV